MDLILPNWTDTYLEVLALHGLPNKAARAARTTKRKVQELRDACIEFDEAVEAALEEANDALEEEARRRALHGYEKGIYHQGSLVAYETVYSDSLLSQMLKAKRPREFGDKREITGPGGGPLTVLIKAFPSHEPKPLTLTATTVPLAADLDLAIAELV